MKNLLTKFFSSLLCFLLIFQSLGASLIENIKVQFCEESFFSPGAVRVSFVNDQTEFWVTQPAARRFLNLDIHGDETGKKESVFSLEKNDRASWLLKSEEHAVIRFLRELWGDNNISYKNPEELVYFSGLIFISKECELPDAVKEQSYFSEEWISSNRLFLKCVDYGMTIRSAGLEEKKAPFLEELLCPSLGQSLIVPEVVRLVLSSLLINVERDQRCLMFDVPFEKEGESSTQYLAYSMIHDLFQRRFDFRDIGIPQDIKQHFISQNPEMLILNIFSNAWMRAEGSVRFSIMQDMIVRLKKMQSILREEAPLNLEDFFSKIMPKTNAIYKKDINVSSRDQTEASYAALTKKFQDMKRDSKTQSPWKRSIVVYQELLENLLRGLDGERLGIFNAHCVAFMKERAEINVPESQTRVRFQQSLSPEIYPLLYDVLCNPYSQLETFQWAYYLGFDVNYRPENKPTLLTVAVDRGKENSVRWLLHHGSTMESMHEGLTPLELVISKRQKGPFIALVETLHQDTRLLFPNEALNWFSGIQGQNGEDNLTAAFKMLMSKDPYFAWLVSLNELFPPSRGKGGFKTVAALFQKKLGSPELTAAQFKLSREEPSPISLNQILEILTEDEKEKYKKESEDFLMERPLVKSIKRAETSDGDFQKALLDEAQFIYRKISSLEEFYQLEMIARFLEEKKKERGQKGWLEQLYFHHAQIKAEVTQMGVHWFINNIKTREKACYFLDRCENFQCDVIGGNVQNDEKEERLASPQVIKAIFLNEDIHQWTFPTAGGSFFLERLDQFPGRQIMASEFLKILFLSDVPHGFFRMNGKWFFGALGTAISDQEMLETLTEDSISKGILAHFLLGGQEDSLPNFVCLEGKIQSRYLNIFKTQNKGILFAFPKQNQYLSPFLVSVFQDLVPITLIRGALEEAEKKYKKYVPQEALLPLTVEEILGFYNRLLGLCEVIKGTSPFSITLETLMKRINPLLTSRDEETISILSTSISRKDLSDIEKLCATEIRDQENPNHVDIFGNILALMAFEMNFSPTPSSAASETSSDQETNPFLKRLKAALISPVFLSLKNLKTLTVADFRGEHGFNPKTLSALDVQGATGLGNDFITLICGAPLYKLNISGTGVKGYVKVNFPTLEILCMENLAGLNGLELEAPTLKTLSLKYCSNLKTLKLKTLLLEEILLEGVPINDALWAKISENSPQLKYANLKGTQIKFSFLKAWGFSLSVEEWSALEKYVREVPDDDTVLVPFTIERKRFDSARLPALAASFVGRVVQGPIQDFKNVYRWGKQKIETQLFPAQSLQSPSSSLHALPLGSLTVAGGVLGPLSTFCLAHPFTAALPLTVWGISAVRDIHKGLGTEKTLARQSFGKILAALSRHESEVNKKTVFSLRGMNLGFSGLAQFVLQGGLENLTELDLRGNHLKDAAAAFLLDYLKTLPKKNRRALSLDLTDNKKISPWLMTEILSLTQMKKREDAGSSSSAAILTPDSLEESSASERPKREHIFGLFLSANGKKGGIKLAQALKILAQEAKKRDDSKSFQAFLNGFQVIGAESAGIISVLNFMSPQKGIFGQKFSTPDENEAFFQHAFLENPGLQNFNLRNISDPIYGLEANSSFWKNHFSVQKLKEFPALVIKVGTASGDRVWSSKEQGDIEINAIAEIATVKPFPYSPPVGIETKEGFEFFHEATDRGNPYFLIQGITERFPSVSQENIHILSLREGEDDTDLIPCKMLGSILSQTSQPSSLKVYDIILGDEINISEGVALIKIQDFLRKRETILWEMEEPKSEGGSKEKED